MSLRRSMAAAMLAAGLLTLCSGCAEDPPPGAKAWTFLLFMNGDNNLEGAALDNLNQLEAVGSSDGVNLVAQVDRSPVYDPRDGDWTGARRLFIEQDDAPDALGSRVDQDLGEVAMNDPDVLEDFLLWGMQSYPAERYGVVIWNHGGGFQVLSVDDSEDGRAATPTAFAGAMRRALDAAERERFDLLIFDMCLMGMIEVDHELAGIAAVRVASEEVVPGKGLDYVASFSALAKQPETSAASFAKRLVDDFASYHEARGDAGDTTLAAVDLERLDSVVGALDDWVAAVLPRMGELWPAVGRAMYYAEAYGEPRSLAGSGTSFIDLAHFVFLTGELSGDPDIQAAGQALLSAIDGAVLASTHGAERPQAHGFSIYNLLPVLNAYAKGDDDLLPAIEAWDGTRFSRESAWLDLLKELLAVYGENPILQPALADLATDTVKQITSSVIEDENRIAVQGKVNGRGLAEVTVEAYAKIDGSYVLMASRRVLFPEKTLSDGTRVPDIQDEVNTFSGSWYPLATTLALGNGIVTNPVVVTGPGGGTIAVAVQYTVAGSGKSFEGQILFKPDVPEVPELGGQISKMFLYQDTPNGKLAAEYTPKPEDSVQSRILYYNDPIDYEESWDGHHLVSIPASGELCGAAPIALVSSGITPQTLLLTIRATDIMGLWNWAPAPAIQIVP